MTDGFIPPPGGYANLLSYRKAEILYDATVYFCDRFFEKRGRTRLTERDKQRRGNREDRPGRNVL